MKILWHSDFCAKTGFSNVAESIVKHLIKKHEVTVIATNYYGEPHNWPIKIYPAQRFNTEEMDSIGFQRVIDELSNNDYDIYFALRDPFSFASVRFLSAIKQIQAVKKFKTVFYAAIDCKPREHWAKELMVADAPVVFTNWAADEVMDIVGSRPGVIYHGTDLDLFKQSSRQQRRALKREMFGSDDVFVVSNINRNIARKDIPSTLMAFKLFHEKVPESRLYLHMRHNDEGGDFRLMAQEMGMSFGKEIFWPELDATKMPELSEVKRVYDFSDVVISTSYGEGWGLSCTEAMSCKVPVIFPNHTACAEIVGEDRGILVNAGADENLWVNRGTEYFNIWCPKTDVKDLADKLVYVYENKEEARKMADNAYRWVSQYTWEKIAKEWEDLFLGLV